MREVNLGCGKRLPVICAAAVFSSIKCVRIIVYSPTMGHMGDQLAAGRCINEIPLCCGEGFDESVRLTAVTSSGGVEFARM